MSNIKLVTVTNPPPEPSSGSDVNKGLPISASELDQNFINLRAAIQNRILGALASNLLANADLLSWGNGDALPPTGYGKWGSLSVAKSTDSRSGFAAQLTFGSTAGKFYQATNISAGVSYTLSCYIKKVSGTGAARLNCQENATTYEEFAQIALPTVYDYQKVVLTFTSPGDHPVTFSILTDNTASVWLIDDCTFQTTADYNAGYLGTAEIPYSLTGLNTLGAISWVNNSEVPRVVVDANSDDFLVMQAQQQLYTILQILAPPATLGSNQEATIALMREDKDGGGAEFMDLYNNGYSDSMQFGVRVQSRGSGSLRDFVFDTCTGVGTWKTTMRLFANNNVSIGLDNNDRGLLLDVKGSFGIATKTPTSATDTGVAGQIAWDANYMYVCIATNTWKRTALTTW